MNPRRFEHIDLPRPHLRGRSIGALAVLGAVALTGLIWVSGATFKAVPVDKIGLHYTGGLLQGQHFKGVIRPGQATKYYGEYDRVYSDNAASAQDVITAQNQAKAKVAAAQGEADAQRARASAPPLTADQVDYIRAQAMQACASNANCTLVITDGGANTNINVGKK